MCAELVIFMTALVSLLICPHPFFQNVTTSSVYYFYTCQFFRFLARHGIRTNLPNRWNQSWS